MFVIPTIAAVYYAITLPVSFDEATTFLLFTHKGFIESVTTYPAPNNHVLHSVITNFTKNIPYLTDLFKLRISSIVVNFLVMLVLYKFVSKHFNKKLALVVVAVSSTLFMTVYYSYMSRGYALLNLFFIINLYCAFNIIKEENQRNSWLVFCISSVCGFYTMPSFLYPFITINFFILLLHKKAIGKLFIVNVITILLVVLTYLPILYHEGIGAIINNPYVQPIGFLETITSLPKFYLKTIQEISGIHWIIMLCLLLFSSYTIIKSNDKITKWFTIIFILAPIVLLSLHGVIPFVRVFFYYNSILVLLLCLPLNKQINQLNYKALLPILVLIQCLLLLNFNSKIYDYEDKDGAINITSNTIIQKIIGDKKYFINGTLLACNLEFNLISKGYKKYEIKEVYDRSVNADTIHHFDYIIIDKERDETKNMKAFLTTDYYSIYKK